MKIMKSLILRITRIVPGGLVLFSFLVISSCKKPDKSVKYTEGTFPDTTFSLTDINSQYDDYNMDIKQLRGGMSIVFSSNRESRGSGFDIEQGVISFYFDQYTGEFGIGSEMTYDAFLEKLLNQANTDGDDLGPYRFFSSADGFDYLLLSSSNDGNLDIFFLKNNPPSGQSLPAITGPLAATRLNSVSDDAYPCFDTSKDTLYFCSNREGDFDIYLGKLLPDTEPAAWLSGSFAAAARVDSVNSTGNDKCPFIHRKIMVFASDRPGGIGGFDLYYSLFRNGKWGSAVNLGPAINTEYNEYRPVISSFNDFTNRFMIFSSDRPSGKGGYDIYASGVTIGD
jgi:hypothetical protein